MPVMPGRDILRRFGRFTPLIIVAALFVGPLIIWLVKDDGPAVVTERLIARIVSIGPAAERERRLVVQLEDGMTVIIRSNKIPLEAKPGEDIEVFRSKLPTGEIDYDLDG